MRKQDHYLVVMIDRAGLRPPGEFLKLCCTALGIVGVAIGVVAVLEIYNIEPPSRASMIFYFWAVMLALAVAYALVRLAVGKRLDELTAKLFERVFQHR
ncbi:MAG: hypothetical protein WAM71_13535 [Candidatus Korobacteraceae bacterium]